MRNPLSSHFDFIDFFNLLADRPLSEAELEKGEAVFATGYKGPVFKRAWFFASIQACICLSHHRMGFSLVEYFLKQEQLHTSANFIAVLWFVSSNPSQDHEAVKEVILEKMKTTLDATDWRVCAKAMREYCFYHKDLETLVELGDALCDFVRKDFYSYAFYLCVEKADMNRAVELVAKCAGEDPMFNFKGA